MSDEMSKALKDIFASDQSDAQIKAIGEWAKVLAVYHITLMERGFTRQEALAITLNWQTGMLAARRSN